MRRRAAPTSLRPEASADARDSVACPKARIASRLVVGTIAVASLFPCDASCSVPFTRD